MLPKQPQQPALSEDGDADFLRDYLGAVGASHHCAKPDDVMKLVKPEPLEPMSTEKKGRRGRKLLAAGGVGVAPNSAKQKPRLEGGGS